jgi:sugar lactone lactonase YvrE
VRLAIGSVLLALGCGGGAAIPDGGAPLDSGASSDTGVACTTLAVLPLAATLVPGAPSAEDFAFDGDGYLVTLSGARNVVRLAAGGAAELLFPNVVANGRGMRILASGDLIIADEARSLLVRVNRAGDISRLTTAVANPNGVELGPSGQIYVTDFGGGGVYRVNPDSGDATVVAMAAAGINGLTFAPDYRALFVADHDAGILYSLDVSADGSLQAPRERARGLGRPDGLGTDECGNVYAASWDQKVYRVTPAGRVDVVAATGSNISAVHFGSGKQGWDQRSLYVMNIQAGGVYEIKVGVRAAPAPR